MLPVVERRVPALVVGIGVPVIVTTVTHVEIGWEVVTSVPAVVLDAIDGVAVSDSATVQASDEATVVARAVSSAMGAAAVMVIATTAQEHEGAEHCQQTHHLLHRFSPFSGRFCEDGLCTNCTVFVSS
ncbi:hypothetical protein ACFL2D_01660 [Patescibacteria group bacterium]